ncbi:MAG TPA: hypothetical protein VN924_05815 [Bryobacteraceae bacterium]|nr:hypothetical protein [Bryobacteraceae bacterium]
MSGIIEILIVVGTALLSVRLYVSGLYRRYRAFFLFLIFSALQNIAVAIVGSTSGAYQKIWVLTEPLEWLLYVCVVLELYALVLHDYRGLYTAGRWLLMVAIVLALLASAGSMLVPNHYTRQGHLMAYYYMAERAIYFSLVVFLLTILALLMRYPITLNRNAITHSMVFSVYFFGNAVIFLLVSTHGYEAIRMAGYATQAVNLAALGTWLAMLNPAGEKRPQILRPVWMPGREAELVSQLNHLNVALLRATRG